jgi:hypothetical protein
VKSRVPCFGFVVKETDKGGPLLERECRKRNIAYEHFPDLKVPYFILPHASTAFCVGCHDAVT